MRSLPASRVLLALALALIPPSVGAQQGDQPGESQPPLPSDLVVPPAPVLSPDEALAAFTVAPGLRVELVAAEPLVNDPVMATFDLRGRLWVVEMTGYMPDVDGLDESAPVGTIAVLTDVDGDGTMDERVEFLSSLVLPRAVAPTRDGALVILPPDVVYARDLDGDLRADERIVIDTGIGGIASPEHAPNGLLPTLDNAFHCANHGRRYRFVDGAFVAERTLAAGQWGLTQDDLGRLVFNTNSDPLRAHLVAPHYGLRNPNAGTLHGLNVGLADDFAVRSARITPGVNRGYRAQTLRDDFTLRTVTAACGPWIHRGDGLPPEYAGSAFVCEPAANCVQRYEIREDPDGVLRASNPHTELDVLTSTDERFRPVNLTGGPDGALYVVDMYRGILQHRIFMTSWLRAQVLDRGLDRPVGLGRIWRLTAADAASRPSPVPLPPTDLGDPLPLVAALDAPNGWLRDRAQQALVEAPADETLNATLHALALAGTPRGRVHSLWALQGRGELTRDALRAALADQHPEVRLTALRLAEGFLLGRAGLVDEVLARADDPDARVRRQAILSLGAVNTPETSRALARIALAGPLSPAGRSALLSGAGGRELELVTALLQGHPEGAASEGQAALLTELAASLTREGRSDRIDALLERALLRPDTAPWQRDALLSGLLDGRPMGPDGRPARLSLATAPSSASVLSEAAAAEVPADGEPNAVTSPAGASEQGALGSAPGALVVSAHAALSWPGHERPARDVVIPPLDDPQRALFEHGRDLYERACATCHQASGRGEPGKAPRLLGSPWVLGSDERLVRILLHGLQGPLRLDDRTWDLDMPALAGGDSDLAAVLTYLRREWGHGADPVAPARVAAIRAASADRDGPWTVPELEQLP